MKPLLRGQDSTGLHFSFLVTLTLTDEISPCQGQIGVIFLAWPFSWRKASISFLLKPPFSVWLPSQDLLFIPHPPRIIQSSKVLSKSQSGCFTVFSASTTKKTAPDTALPYFFPECVAFQDQISTNPRKVLLVDGTETFPGEIRGQTPCSTTGA